MKPKNKRWPTVEEVQIFSKQMDHILLNQGERLARITNDIRNLFDEHSVTIQDSVAVMMWMMRQLREDPDMPHGLAAILLAAREDFPIQLGHVPLGLGEIADFVAESEQHQADDDDEPKPTPPRGKLRVVH
jgi:hypothetical protein